MGRWLGIWNCVRPRLLAAADNHYEFFNTISNNPRLELLDCSGATLYSLDFVGFNYDKTMTVCVPDDESGNSAFTYDNYCNLQTSCNNAEEISFSIETEDGDEVASGEFNDEGTVGFCGPPPSPSPTTVPTRCDGAAAPAAVVLADTSLVSNLHAFRLELL